MYKKRGFTLIEILIVVAILAILGTITAFSLLSNLGKSRDSKRKADLSRLKTAFEEYYVDNNEYPLEDILLDCNGSSLRPYIANIPCDPKTKQPYCYIYDADNKGQNFKILSSLENINDPVIATLDCADNPDYCGYEDTCTELGFGSKFDYGISSSNVLVNRENIGGGSLVTPTPSPTPVSSPVPVPSSVPGNFACTPLGACDGYTNPGQSPYFCPITFINQPQCASYCPTSPVGARCKF